MWIIKAGEKLSTVGQHTFARSFVQHICTDNYYQQLFRIYYIFLEGTDLKFLLPGKYFDNAKLIQLYVKKDFSIFLFVHIRFWSLMEIILRSFRFLRMSPFDYFLTFQQSLLNVVQLLWQSTETSQYILHTTFSLVDVGIIFQNFTFS